MTGPRAASLLGLLLAGCALGCGASSHAEAPLAKPPLLEGTGVYTLRYNPPLSLVDAPDLHFEVQTATGWERVSVEDAEREVEAPVVPKLRQMLTQPGAPTLIQVQGHLGDPVRPWAGHHAARTLRISALSPTP